MSDHGPGGGGGGGGWIGSTPSTGAVSRTYGLGGHLTKGFDGPAPVIDRVRVRRALAYFAPYWRQWLVVVVCLALSAALLQAPPWLVGKYLDDGVIGKRPLLVLIFPLAMVLSAVVAGLIGVLHQSLAARAGQSIVFDLRNELYGHLQQMSLRFYTATRSGEIVSRINNDVNAVQSVATGTLTSIVQNLLMLVATSIMMFWMSWRLALLSLVIVPAFYVPSRIVGGIRRRLSRRTQESQAALLAFLHERLHLGGAVLTKIFGQSAVDAQVFRGHSGELLELNVKQAIVGRWLFMSLSVFGVTGPALIYAYGGLQVLSGELRVGMVVAFAALLGNLYRPLYQLATVYVDIQASLAVFERIFEYLDLSPDVTDRPEALALANARGHVVFDAVSFGYPKPLSATGLESTTAADSVSEKLPFALDDVSFEIQPGQQVALVGPSGAGKTTITYLLPRFYDVRAGAIRIDGHDVRDLAQESLRSHIGMVTQETFLFNASVRDNLLYARPSAPEAEIVAAARAAQIHDFIAGLPDGYDTIVGERGFRLSGGEKQRLAIARALLKDPTVLILDEATSNLDATSEALIQQALETLLHGRTALIIAHRLSTILSSDRIVVLDHGRIVDQGTHTELLARGGLYRQLFERQFSKVLDAQRARTSDDRAAE